MDFQEEREVFVIIYSYFSYFNSSHEKEPLNQFSIFHSLVIQSYQSKCLRQRNTDYATLLHKLCSQTGYFLCLLNNTIPTTFMKIFLFFHVLET